MSDGSFSLTSVKALIERIELAFGQRYNVLTNIANALGQRLDRMEALLLNEQKMRHSLHKRLEDLQENGGTAAMPAGAPLFATRCMDIETILRLEPIVRCPDIHTDLRALSGRLRSGLPFAIEDASHEFDALAAARRLVKAASQARGAIPPGTPLLWIVRRTDGADGPNPDELTQAMGLLGTDLHVLASTVGGLTVVAGVRRAERQFAVLRIATGGAEDAAILEGVARLAQETRRRLRPAIRFRSLAQMSERGAEETVAAIEAALGPIEGGREYGVVWPHRALHDIQGAAGAAARLRRALGRHEGRLVFQWVDGALTVDDSAAVSMLAEVAGMALDLTPVAQDLHGGDLVAYESFRPYFAPRFDLRIPDASAANGERRPLHLARSEPVLGACAQDPFRETVEKRAARLERVLDRFARRRLLEWLALGNEQAGSWERFHVYNWKPPEDVFVHAAVFDVLPRFDDVDLGTVDRAVAAASDLSVEDVVTLGGTATLGIGDEEGLSLQVEAHAYLTDRREPSPDSLRILDWLPERLGETLELGSGYAVLGRRIVERTSRYVGIDLTIAQGKAVADIGGLPLIADMHALPFPADAFDTIVADNVIEHARDPIGALREICRVLKAGGRAYLLLPLDQLGPTFSNRSHLWKADEASIRSALRTCGLNVRRAETIFLPGIENPGSFPSCRHRTSLWEVEPAVAADKAASFLAWSEAAVPPPDVRSDSEAVDAEAAEIAFAVSEEIGAINRESDLTPLARNSPALATFDWSAYLRLSNIRIVRASRALKRHAAGRRVLDMGSYFGNFSMTLRRAGWEPVALDSYRAYDGAFARHVERMAAEGIEVLDYAEVGHDLSGLSAGSFDAVLCMGVVEHIPHTPRLLLEAVDRVLRPGGLLVMDTPNLAYQYQRDKLADGRSVFPSIDIQFETPIPFEGHHREYTSEEMRWMMQRVGYRIRSLEMFNRSVYGFAELSGIHLDNFRRMQADESRRELILVAAEKPEVRGR